MVFVKALENFDAAIDGVGQKVLTCVKDGVYDLPVDVASNVCAGGLAEPTQDQPVVGIPTTETENEQTNQPAEDQNDQNNEPKTVGDLQKALGHATVIETLGLLQSLYGFEAAQPTDTLPQGLFEQILNQGN